MTRAATLYYLEDNTQAEIAVKLGILRAKVGRLLKRAREEGIVEITIHPHPAMSLSLEANLKERFGLRHVFLASDHADPDLQRGVVAQAAAHYLTRTLEDGMSVAVGMGRNVGAIPDHLLPPATCACTFVSALGGSPQIGLPINPNDISRRLAERFRGMSESLYAPAYAETAAGRDLFMHHETIQQTLGLARRADLALVGIGDARDDSAVVHMGCFSTRDMVQLRQAGAVGDIIGAFFDIRGHLLADGMENRVVGLSGDDLRAIPTVVAIASEREKAHAMLGALRSGLVQVLVTSMGNAHTILKLDEESRREA